MLVIPQSPADPIRLAEDAIEELKREHRPRPVKTNKKKPKRRGAIGTPPAHNRKVLSGEEN
jgi:hypothetical protein